MKRKFVLLFLAILLVCTGCTDLLNPNSKPTQEVSAPIEIKDISNAELSDLADQKYTGKEIMPSLTITMDETVLIEGTDYTIGYFNNVKVGEATVVVTGIGYYTGSKETHFKIIKTSSSKPRAVITCVKKTYNGQSQEIATCSGGDISNAEQVNAGTYKITCKGDASHSNANSKKCSIETDDITLSKIAAIANQKYTGKEIKPIPDIVKDDIKLVNNIDYTLEYKNNIKIGEATVIVKGKGNYTGTKETTFKILGTESPHAQAIITCTNKAYNGTTQTIATCSGGTISGANQTNVGEYTITCKGDSTHTDAESKKCSITKASIYNATIATITNQTYTGKAIAPTPTVTLNGKLLTRDVDYTLSYANNTNVGTATVTIDGKGNYEGKKSATFKIVELEQPKTPAVITCANKTYSGSTQTIATCSGGTISNASQLKVGSYTITCKGDSTHTDAESKKCNITQASITTATIAAVADQKKTGLAIKPTPAVTLGGKTLAKDVDYTLTYNNNINVGTATIIVTGKGNYTGVKESTFKIVEEKTPAVITCTNKTYNGNTQIIATCSGGTISGASQTQVGKYTITCKGDSSHTDATARTCSITIANVSGAVISTIAAQTYTGSAITPTPAVTLNGKTLTKDKDYTLSYSNNINVGTGTVTVTGKGNYTGTKSATFAINKASIASAIIATITSQTYTGKAITPIPTVTLNGKTLTKDKDYTLSYSNNINIGTGTVTVTGKGNYTNTKTATFKIVQGKTPAVITCSNKTYNGNTQVIATCSGGTISNASKIDVGSYTVKCKGDSTHTDATSKLCLITAESLSNATVNSISEQKYTGKQITPTPTVKVGTRTLTKDVDYTLSYQSNVNVGTAIITITGKTNYAGTKTVTFKIVDNKTNVPLVIVNNYDYTVATINVLDFGADKDGSKDSTAAFNAALTKAAHCLNGKTTCDVIPGGVVYVPAGKYKIDGQLVIPERVSLIGELAVGTKSVVDSSGNAKATILMLNYKEGTTDYKNAAIKVGNQAEVKNMAFWYPNQKINSSNKPIAYPPTILQDNWTEGITLENLIFINSYIAMDLENAANNLSIQFVKDIYGTPLHTGLVNDKNLDTIKIENLKFNSSYWLESGFTKNKPTSTALANALMDTSTEAIVLKRVDWYFLSNISITGYYKGIALEKSASSIVSSNPTAEGEIYDSSITNCFYSFYTRSNHHTAITSTTLTAANKTGATPLYIVDGITSDIAVNSSTITASGSNNAIYNGSTRALSLVGSKVTGKITVKGTPKMAFVGNTLTNTGYESKNANIGVDKPAVPDYKRHVTTKSVSVTTNDTVPIKVVTASAGSDITSQLNQLISSLGSSGGIIYIPVGDYKISSTVTVNSKIEIRGSVPAAHHSGGSVINTSYYNGPIFHLKSNSGINGITIQYSEIANPATFSGSKTNYAIRGEGSNIFIMNVAIKNAWNGVDLATYRCDNHYVYRVWGSFLETGIAVGKSSDKGIVRDCHITTNVLSRTNTTTFQNNYKYTLEHETAFSIGSTTNQIFFHNFVWGPNIGYNVTGTSNYLSLVSCGVDYGNKGIKVNGTVTNGKMINMLLVTKPTKNVGGVTLNINPVYNNYIDTTHAGYINIVNPVLWGNGNPVAIAVKGTGNSAINGGIVDNSGTPIVQNSATNLSLFGTIFRQSSATEIDNVSGSKNANYACPICVDGSCLVTNQSSTIGYNKTCSVN